MRAQGQGDARGEFDLKAHGGSFQWACAMGSARVGAVQDEQRGEAQAEPEPQGTALGAESG
jgi:hypothetical protein